MISRLRRRCAAVDADLAHPGGTLRNGGRHASGRGSGGDPSLEPARKEHRDLRARSRVLRNGLVLPCVGEGRKCC
jgi:hypothetical protein